MQTESLGEEALDALDIASEVELGIGVRCGHHLGEVDYRHLLIVVNHQIELVEVTVDESVLGELNDELDKAMVDLFGVDETFDVDHGVSLDEGHDDTVSVGIDGHG